MAFDPDAYLAKKSASPAPSGGFDPDAYLQKKAWESSPEYARLKAKHDETVSKVAALNAEPDPWSPGEVAKAVGGSLKDRLVGLARGAKDVISHPIATFAEPERRRQFERGIDDAVTLGYGKKAADWLTSKLPASLQHGTSGTAPASFAETEAGDQAAAPDTRSGGQLVGAFLPGAVKTAGKAAGGLAAKVTSSAPLRTVVAYEAAAPALSALHADSDGHRLDAAVDAALDPAGVALAAGAGAVGGKVSSKIRNSKGGRARQLIEDEGQGARVSPLSAGSGGVFADELAGIPANDKGIGIAARRGAQGVMEGLREEKRQNVDIPYRDAKAAADARAASMQPRDVSSLVRTMRAAAADLETDDAVVGKLERKLNQLEAYRQGENGPVMLPERQLNGLRRSLMRMAKVGATDAPGEREAPLRAAAFAAKRMVDEGPYARVNRFYAEGAAANSAARRQLGLKGRPSSDSSMDTKKVKLGLEREVQNTKTAGGDTDLETFRAQHPDLAIQTRLAQLQNAKADLSFRLTPQHGGLIERAAGGLIGPAGAVIAHAAGAGPAGIVGGLGYVAAQNAAPIAGRLLYPMAAGTRLNPLVLMAQEQRRRQAELAARLRGGR